LLSLQRKIGVPDAEQPDKLSSFQGFLQYKIAAQKQLIPFGMLEIAIVISIKTFAFCIR
jgi:hypothetical protein